MGHCAADRMTVIQRISSQHLRQRRVCPRHSSRCSAPHCEHITSPRCPDAYQITPINHTIWAKSMRAPIFPVFYLFPPCHHSAEPASLSPKHSPLSSEWPSLEPTESTSSSSALDFYVSTVWTKLWVASPARTALSFSSPPFLCSPAVTLIETKAFCECVLMFMAVFTGDGSGGPSQHSVLKGPSSLQSLQVLLVY